ncbi:GAF domain-containing protein [Lacibacterium aquatile]|uniref:GAF domain-containing protein n=1 Tax=Lacibacterium aquatile TaxID=1168082 RepID=A0ABW5DQP2_9PROT
MTSFSAPDAKIEAFLSLARAIAAGGGSDAAFKAAEDSFRAAIGFTLFTVMLYDEGHKNSVRFYSSDTGNYPVGGAKPMDRNAYYQHVVVEGRAFVANTPDEWKPFYVDYEKVFALGLRSAVNVPIRLNGRTVGSVNILHSDRPYTQEDAIFGQGLATLLGTALNDLITG